MVVVVVVVELGDVEVVGPVEVVAGRVVVVVLVVVLVVVVLVVVVVVVVGGAPLDAPTRTTNMSLDCTVWPTATTRPSAVSASPSPEEISATGALMLPPTPNVASGAPLCVKRTMVRSP